MFLLINGQLVNMAFVKSAKPYSEDNNYTELTMQDGGVLHLEKTFEETAKLFGVTLETPTETPA